MKLHLGTDKPACGVFSEYKLPLTTDRKQVTCGRCIARKICARCRKPKPFTDFKLVQENRVRKRLATCYSCRQYKKTQSPYYADHNFPGLGVLRCKWCGNPYRDHVMPGPCPHWGDAA